MKTREELGADILAAIRTLEVGECRRECFASTMAGFVLLFQKDYDNAGVRYPERPSETHRKIDSFLGAAQKMAGLLQEMGPDGRSWLAELCCGPVLNDQGEQVRPGWDDWPNRFNYSNSAEFDNAFLARLELFLAPLQEAGRPAYIRRGAIPELSPGSSYRGVITRETMFQAIDRSFIVCLASGFRNILDIKPSKSADGPFEETLRSCLNLFEPGRGYIDVHKAVCEALHPNYSPASICEIQEFNGVHEYVSEVLDSRNIEEKLGPNS
jgi:hypothetical protein